VQIFPKRASLLKLSVARHEKGEKANYCLSCLISLIELVFFSHADTLVISFHVNVNVKVFSLVVTLPSIP
jgi:hypothetical protein